MIYTRTGDKGLTSLMGGERVEKHSLRVEAYGSLDELNSFLGHSYDLMANADGIVKDDLETLYKIMNNVFEAQTLVSCKKKELLDELPQLEEKDIIDIENEIDKASQSTGGFRGFLLPCGHPIASSLHIARTICRRTERALLRLGSEEEVDNNIIIYINRLSDYLFVLSRKVLIDLGLEEVYYRGRE